MSEQANISCLRCHGEYQLVGSYGGENRFECEECGHVLCQVSELEGLRDDGKDDAVAGLAEILLEGVDQ